MSRSRVVNLKNVHKVSKSTKLNSYKNFKVALR